MSGSYPIYINGEEGVYPRARLLQKAPRVNTEPLAASMLLPMIVEEGVNKPSVTDPQSGRLTPRRLQM